MEKNQVIVTVPGHSFLPLLITDCVQSGTLVIDGVLVFILETLNNQAGSGKTWGDGTLQIYL